MLTPRVFLQQLFAFSKVLVTLVPLYVFYAWKHRVLGFMFLQMKGEEPSLASIGWRYLAMFACANSGLDHILVCDAVIF